MLYCYPIYKSEANENLFILTSNQSGTFFGIEYKDLKVFEY